MNKSTRIALTPAVSALTGICLLASAASVPVELPKPDGKPGDATKPVQVYILAGQSNMVGFGTLSGARPQFSSSFLSADPATVPGTVQVGRDRRGLLRFGVYQTAQPKSAKGAKVALFRGAFDANADYARLKPEKETTVALGTVSQQLPEIPGPHTKVATACITVPVSGNFTVHPGFGDSTHAIAVVDGREVYRKEIGGQTVIEKLNLEKGKRYPVTITYLKNGSAALWLEQVDMEGKGDLEKLTTEEGKFPWMIDQEGKWTVRNDVTYAEARIAPEGRWCPLSATSNGKFIGPEVPFGYVMGTFHDEQVLLIETSMGNRGLWWDFRPPSSGREDPDNEWEGKEYRLMVEGVRKILGKIDEVVPGYRGQGYEMAGFVWWQGHKDYSSGQPKAEYEKHLVNLINDVRKEFDAPKMPAAIATIGFGGYNMGKRETEIWKAQMAVGNPEQHPEFAGMVATVDTRGYWRPASESPTGAGYHYNHNAETYMLTGDALGRAMAALKGGQVKFPPQPQEPSEDTEAEKAEPTAEELAASRATTVPMILDGMLPSYINNPHNKTALAAAAGGVKPKRSNQFLNDSIDGLNAYYGAAGITDYHWEPFGPDMVNATWQYFTFDPPEQMDKAKGARYRKVTYPEGMENWFAPGFDAEAAGWKSGRSPFGQKKGELVPLGGCRDNHCNCGVPPRTLWDKEVLLMRQTFKIPPLKEGHRYRILVGGSNHVNAGEGFAIYADGKLLAESQQGVHKRQGGQPRGAHVYADAIPHFEDGEVTIAVKSFLRYNQPRTEVYPRGHISVWLEEQKIPPIPE